MTTSFASLLSTALWIIFISGSRISSEPSLGAYEVTLHSAKGLTINITQNGVFKVLVNGEQWLHSASTFFTTSGETFSTEAGNLKPTILTEVTPGQDDLGQFTYISFSWVMNDVKKSQVTTSFRAYREFPAIVFSQKFPEELVNTSVRDADAVCTGFPSFQIGASDLGFMSYGGEFLTTTQFGTWLPGTEKIQSGLYGGPLALFDQYRNTMVMSSFSEFMASSIYNDRNSNSIQFGIIGRATSIPKGFTYETVLYFGNGIKQTITDYGKMLMEWYGKPRDIVENDITITSLSYWTDRGAYYYKRPDQSRTYEQILLDVKTYADSNKIPYRSFQLDAWWYYTGDGGGTKNWTALPSVFPDGLQASNTDYAKENGGKWNFIVERQNSLSLPLDEDFWYFLLSTSKNWGLALYEQDFLDEQFEQMNICVENVTVGRQWLLSMGAGASRNKLPIQYCMPMPRHLLQSVEIPYVTQARASDDYQPGNSQWNIGLSSILLHAIGLAPFKDNFWTTSKQPNNPYSRVEPYPALESMVATFSTGPVGPSDMIGKSNTTLIMRSVNTDGDILKPSRPAMALDGYILRRAFGHSGINGLIWSTVSDITAANITYRFGHILVFEVDEVTNLTSSAADLDKIGASYAYKDGDPLNTLQKFDDNNPIRLPLLLRKDFQLWHTSPLIKFGENTVVILGELTKWVKVSPHRINFLDSTNQNLTLNIAGPEGETVEIDLMVNMQHMQASCTIGKGMTQMIITGSGKFKCSNGS